MATADQLKALIRSHGEGDDTRFYSVALQVAAKAAQGGQGRLAQELKELVDAARNPKGARRREGKVVGVVEPKGDLAELLTLTYPEDRLSDLSLDPVVEARLLRFLVEQRQRDQLSAHGLTPSRRLLLVGPPGTGKTYSTRVVAGELGLPLFTIRLDGLLTKFLGESSSKLRMVFDAMQLTRGVYFFDEVDALAGERSAGNDVGEIRRVLNSFLQFLESDPSDSVLIAATNHPRLLDKAIFRRFDMVVDFPMPTALIARSVIKNRLGRLPKARINWTLVDKATAGFNHGEIALAAEQAAKNAVLSSRLPISTDQVVHALNERRHDHRESWPNGIDRTS